MQETDEQREARLKIHHKRSTALSDSLSEYEQFCPKDITQS
ncbi:hypothetical protein P4S72_06420 [Vibrio sp. PP-XX7]